MSNYDFTGIVDWNRIEGWFDLPKAVAVQICVKSLPQGATLVELGSFKGRSSVAIAAVLPEGSRLHCVDHFLGSAEHAEMAVDISDIRAAFAQNIEAFGVTHSIETLEMTTIEAAKRFADESVHLILLDASHDFASVKADLEAWYPKLRPGGYLFCDDYDPHWPGVMQAVQAMGLAGKLAAKALFLHQKPTSAG